MIVVADQPERIGGGLNGGAGGAEACQQARQRNDVNGRQRDDTPAPNVLTGLPAVISHSRSPNAEGTA